MKRLFLAALLLASPVLAQTPVESPALAPLVAEGKLPPIALRLPDQPLLTPGEPGHPGGTLRLLMAGARDVRMMVVYGYARLVGYTPDYQLEPDLLARFDNQDDRVFTLHLRPGHRWSDGHPFTAEDFRYFWEDVALNDKLSPTGPPAALLVQGKKPRFEVLDSHTVRYSWDDANPGLPAALAGAAPLYLYRPAHYLKRFHAAYADPATLATEVKQGGARNWAQLHNRLDNQYRNDNPDLPTLDPWINTTKAPAERFVFRRNPYYHRLDSKGQQLPYLDRVDLHIADGKIIAMKAGAGESDLQARYLAFDNYTFLRQAAKQRGDFQVDLWQTAKGAHLALYPNLTAKDPVWRGLMRDVRFRRALSLGINRHEINQVVFYGLGVAGNNTTLPGSPLHDPANRSAWAGFDIAAANKLLDEIGLTTRDSAGTRVLPDGRPANIVIEAPGDSAEQTDALQLIRDSWRRIGIRLLIKATHQDVFRNRVFAGDTVMSVASGAENALPHENMSPAEWAPTQQVQWQWCQWGNFVESGGKAGQAPDLPEVVELQNLYRQWLVSGSATARAAIWRRMLAIHADQQFTIGLVAAVPQPVLVSNRLRNVPKQAVWNWDPGAHFGVQRMDRFWLAPAAATEAKP